MSEFQASNFKKENGGAPDTTGVTNLKSPYFFVPPSGDTKSRPLNCAAGTLRFNTDFGTLEVYRGDKVGWEQIQRRDDQYLGGGLTSGSIDGTGTRAIFAGGYAPSGGTPNQTFDTVDAITVETLGNAIDFNNLSSARVRNVGFSDATRSFAAGGVGPVASQYSTIANQIEFCNFSSQNNYIDFGDLTDARGSGAGFSDKTRGCVAGGTYGYTNIIDYVTMQSAGNAVDFGDLITNKTGENNGLQSSTRGFSLGGVRYNAPDSVSFNTIQVVTIQTTGNTTDFGDMMYANYAHATASNATRGIKAGGYGPNYTTRIEYLTLSSEGNTVRFGDLTNLNGTGKQAGASPTRYVLGGGYTSGTPFVNIMEYVQIATTGNAADFGDLTYAKRNGTGGTSNGHGGL
jgi:hypothetical protein|tara:strand:- start:2077 stop:3279 length:1203 start_codon:yes stop_codon:yes gene_type:complete